MKTLTILLVCLGINAMAGNQDESTVGNANNINNCNPTVVCNSRIIYATDKQKQKIAELEAEIAKLKQENAELAASYNEALYAIHNMQPTIVVEKQAADKNAISLLGLESATDLKTENTANGFKARTAYEPDAGLMYQHDFDSVRGSIGATLHGTMMLGVGLTF